MPADIAELQKCLSEMKDIYLNNPDKAVRSSEFIYPLHRYCIAQLKKAIASNEKIQIISVDDMIRSRNHPNYPRIAIDASGYQLMQEATLFGSHKNKDADIVFS